MSSDLHCSTTSGYPNDIILVSRSHSCLADTLLLQTLTIRDNIQIPNESYGGLTGSDSRYYGITDRQFWWYQKNNFIVLTPDKVATMIFSYDIIS